jgi:threonylcarbamoyladenosine tRNA methylthiotransferase MtaB
LNQAEGNQLTAALIAAGATLAKPDTADLIIVLTCTVTAEAESKTLKAVRRMLHFEPRLGVLASGCAVAINQPAFALYGDKLTAVPNVSEATVIALELLGEQKAEKLMGERRGQIEGQIGDGSAMSYRDHGIEEPCSIGLQPALVDLAAGGRRRLNLKVQDGCNEACSYCIVRYARGPSRYEPLSQIVAAAQAAEANGFLEIVLTGVNIGSYVSPEAGSLTALLKVLLKETSKARYRLSSIEPNDASDELVDLIADNSGRICAHLHLPLQSGSDAVLEAMKRPYTADMYRARVAYARKQLPDLALSTDVIVGFPGETEADFQATLNFCQEMKYMRMHIFRYSIREGTEAARMPEQIAPAVKAERSEALSILADQLTEVDLQARIGKTELALVERSGYARTESYHLAKIPESLKTGELIPIYLDGHEGRLLKATERNNAIQ